VDSQIDLTGLHRTLRWTPAGHDDARGIARASWDGKRHSGLQDPVGGFFHVAADEVIAWLPGFGLIEREIVMASI